MDALEAIQLFEPDALAEAKGCVRQYPQPEAFVRELLGLGLITPFQAARINQSHPDSLRIGDYIVIEQLGSGGMGHVFKAVHMTDRKIACLKVIREELQDSDKLVKRFEREWRAVKRLAHPNIVAAYDTGKSGEAVFYAMEFVDGIDLGRHIQNVGPLPIPDVVSYMRQAALALQHAHEAKLIHRDIKPDNFLLEEATGVVKLLDLGLCRVNPNEGEDAVTALTVRGTAIGTPEYMAPEQIRDATSVDERADLYALGCTMYYLLTGQDPFRGKSPMDVMLMQVRQEPVPINQLRPEVPQVVVWAVTQLMKKKKEERFQTAAELVAYFDKLLAVDPSQWAQMPAGAAPAKMKPSPSKELARPVEPSQPVRPQPQPQPLGNPYPAASVEHRPSAAVPKPLSNPVDHPSASPAAIAVFLAGSAAFVGGFVTWWINTQR
jgi:serine/threonine protein kinase